MKIEMEYNQKLLSICIPTYNRIEQIQKQVRLLLPQLTEEVQLVVYDNHSDISISELFTEQELSKFILIRNCVNIGGDANIARCFENCNTKWLWTLADDDFVRETSVSILLEDIKNNQDATFINYWSPIEKYTDNIDSFLKMLSNGGVFCAAFTMSVCVYNMYSLKEDLFYYYKNISSMVGPLIMLIRNILKKGGKCIWLNKPLVELGADVGWNYQTFINYSFLFLQEFSDSKHIYQKTIFLGLFRTDYSLISIDRESSHIDWFSRFKLFGKVLMKQGIINALLYTPKEFFKCFALLFISRRFKCYLKKLFKS